MAEIRVKETGTIKLFESDNTSSVTIASPASLGADRTITLPDASVTLASGTMNDATNLSGNIPVSNLNSGTSASSSTFWRGDGTWVAPSGGATLTGSTDNTITTVTGADAIQGEANLTFDGSTFTVTGSSSLNGAVVVNEDGSSVDIRMENQYSTHALFSDSSESCICLYGSDNPATVSAISSGGTGQFVYGENSSLVVAANYSTTGVGHLVVNRVNNDGNLVDFRQAGSVEGTISVSGSTVSYNAFCGSHWSRLGDNSKPSILRGTVLESIATMVDWYQVEYSKVNNLGENITVKKSITLPEGKNVGDVITYADPEDNNTEYSGTIIKEDNERLPMCKISDTENSKAVYGVFMEWDGDDDGINDMLVASLGAFMVRIHSEETVAIGDYLQSKGDGTAKVQADDILRSSTIAKVTSTEKTITHADGSYCVPCTLHCG